MRTILKLVVGFAFAFSPVAALAQSGGGCGISSYPCYSRILGNGATLTDRSGTVTLGGTAQQLMAANAVRGGCFIQNLSNGDEWINSLGTASPGPGSIWVPAGSAYECPSTGVTNGAISIYGATTGQAFTAREW